MRKFIISIVISIATLLSTNVNAQIWSIGTADDSANEFALAPDGYDKFLEQDFGWEDRFFFIGKSDAKSEFPYTLPGPVDTWGGTWSTSGWRINFTNILFTLGEKPSKGEYTLVVELSDYAKKFLPLVKISINDHDFKEQLTASGYNLLEQPHPSHTEATVNLEQLTHEGGDATPMSIEIPVPASALRQGGNQVTITVLEGSWIKFDNIRLEGPSNEAIAPNNLFIKSATAAEYEITQGEERFQPLLIAVEHIEGTPSLEVIVDGEKILSQSIEKGSYVLEAPMPTKRGKKSSYSIFCDGKLIEQGVVQRQREPLQTYADYIDTRYGTGHSRWMIAPGPWMPFSMVKLSPDNQNDGWQSGYNPAYESIGTFSHIHEWTMGGLGIFASNGELKTQMGDELSTQEGYRSQIDKRTERAPIGSYEVVLKDYDIKAELTGTTRCGFMRFTFPEDSDQSRILVDLNIPSEYPYQLKEVVMTKVSDYRIEGYAYQHSLRVWSDDADQKYKLHFVLEFDQPIQSMGTWEDDNVTKSSSINAKDLKEAGAYIQFDTKKNRSVQLRSGVSMVSVENASENLKTEIIEPFGWDYAAICQHQKDVWNDIFDRVKITSSNRLEKERFYSCMYRSICSRNIWSDVNGEWVGTDGATHKFENPEDVALGCDAFWNTFWNLNQFWNLVTPEWSNKWVKSQLAMYDAYGWLSKGPAGMNYIPVMVAEHEIPMIVGAYQMGIRDFDANKALEAAVKMQSTPAQKLHTGFVGNRDLTAYLQHKYVPSDLGRFSNTMEYSYDDWCVGQMAKSLGQESVYETFNDRGYWWRNVMNPQNGYCHLKDSKGEWMEDFDPFKSGANHHYVEANSWQMSYFVPQDVPALIDILGTEAFVDRLEWGFKQSDIWRYNGMNDQYWNYPVIQGNQQSMHFSFLFNWAGKPWSTQKWSRSILDRYYGYGVWNAYLGDEDQGQMSAWLVMAAMGLFQTDGGCATEPIYEIGSPLFERIEIDLGERFGRGESFVVEAKNASRENMYIQSATLNGKALNSFKFPAQELLGGGSLILEMGPTPNKSWGVE